MSIFTTFSRICILCFLLIRLAGEEWVISKKIRPFIPSFVQKNWKRKERSIFLLKREERIKLFVESLGPVFIKIGQALSNRIDLFPDYILRPLEQLQDNISPFSHKITEEVIYHDYKKTITEIFDNFSSQPIASASVGQVYKAKLKNTSTTVVVKILRPGIRKEIKQDLDLIKFIALLINPILKLNGVFNAQTILKSFEESLLGETNYLYETNNMVQFKELYANDPHIYVPKIFPEYSTKNILVMEYLDGCKITDKTQLINWHLSPESLAINAFTSYLKQMFLYGVFHADPHPGNILISPQGTTILLDYGMIGKVDANQRIAFAHMLSAIYYADGKIMAENLEKLALNKKIKDYSSFQQDLQEIADYNSKINITEFSLRNFLSSLLKIMRKHRIEISGDVLLMFRALSALEGTGKIIYPEMEIFKYIGSFRDYIK